MANLGNWKLQYLIAPPRTSHVGSVGITLFSTKLFVSAERTFCHMMMITGLHYWITEVHL